MSSNLACQRTQPFMVSAFTISTNIATSGTASRYSNLVCHAALLFACLGIMTILCLSWFSFVFWLHLQSASLPFGFGYLFHCHALARVANVINYTQR